MNIRAKFLFTFFCASIALLSVCQSVHAQSYSAINTSRKLYCVHLPNDTKMLARVTFSRDGQINTLPIDKNSEAKAIRKIIKQHQKRVKTLKKIKKENDPTSVDLATVRKVIKFVVNNDVFQEPKPSQVFKAISKLVAQLQSMIASLESDLAQMDACERGELPPPEAGSAMVINYPFLHPDYKETYQIFGLGFIGFIDKKATYGKFCVSAQKAFKNVAKFPKETQFTVQRNGCLLFYPSSFRNYPFYCGAGAINGNANTVVGWFEPWISPSGPSESSITSFENQLKWAGPINIRPWTKKTPCRLK